MKLQAHNTKTVKEYRSALHCASRILSTEGVRGLYRGASSSFIGMSIESSISFGLYSQTKQLLEGETHGSKPQLQAIIPSAAFAGAVVSSILCPAELVKCRLQVQGRDTAGSNYVRYAGPLDCALRTIKNEGILGIFRGGFSTLLRESIGTATFFSTYELTRYYMHSQVDSMSSAQSGLSKSLSDVGLAIISGGVAGMAFWTVVLPFDVAKTIIQTAPHLDSSRNPFETLYSIYRRVGLRGCYAGLGPTLLRAFPANAAAIVAWECTAKFLGSKRD